MTDHDDLRSTLAANAGFEGEAAETFAGLLQGEDEKEIRAHAQKLAEFFGGNRLNAAGKPHAFDKSQGHGDGDQDYLDEKTLVQSFTRALDSLNRASWHVDPVTGRPDPFER